MDPWGSNEWNTPEPAPAPVASPPAYSSASTMQVPDTLTANDVGGGWGSSSGAKPTPTVAADEDFGGWTSAAPVSSGPTATSHGSSKPAGGFGGGSDDLFSNVWE